MELKLKECYVFLYYLVVPSSVWMKSKIWKLCSDTHKSVVCQIAHLSNNRLFVLLQIICPLPSFFDLINREYPYIRMSVRFHMIFKYTELICRKPDNVSETMHMGSQLNYGFVLPLKTVFACDQAPKILIIGLFLETSQFFLRLVFVS